MDEKKMDKAARVLTKRRWRQVKKAIVNNNLKFNENIINVKNQIVKSIEKEKKIIKTIPENKKVNLLLTNLGREVYDMECQGMRDIINQKKILEILNHVTKIKTDIDEKK